MDKAQELTQQNKENRNIKTAAKIALVVLLLTIVGQFISVYQTKYQLVSPLIPENTIWEINKQFIFTAFISTIICIVGLFLYFYEKYLWIIILIAITLLSERFINI
jgi:hypothetical protein